MHSIHGNWASYFIHVSCRLKTLSICGVLLMLLCVETLDSQTSPAHEALENALRLANLYNWAEAAPAFSRAQQLFTKAGDTRNALFARLGLLRATIERK